MVSRQESPSSARVDKYLVRGLGSGAASVGLYLIGWMWTAAAFVAKEPAWWNSIVVVLAIFGGATVLAWRAKPNVLGLVMLVISAGTFALLAIAFGPSVFRR